MIDQTNERLQFLYNEGYDENGQLHETFESWKNRKKKNYELKPEYHDFP